MMRERYGKPIPFAITNRNSYTGDWLARSYIGTPVWLRLVGAVTEHCDGMIMYGEGRFVITKHGNIAQWLVRWPYKPLICVRFAVFQFGTHTATTRDDLLNHWAKKRPVN